MSDLNDILSGKEPDEPKPDVKPEEPAPEPEAQEGAAEAETEAQTEPQEAEEKPEEPASEPAKDEQPMVPASVVAELRRELRELRQQKPQEQPKEPEKAPDVLDNPAEYAKFVQTQTQRLAQDVKLDISEEMARSEHGDAVVDEAFEALKSTNDPASYQKILNARHPWNELVNWHKQQQVVREIGPDPNKWMEAQREAIRKEVEAELVAKQVKEQASQKAPSLANATGKGGTSSAGWQGPADLDALLKG